MADHLSVVDKHPLIWRAAQQQTRGPRLPTQHTDLDNALGGGLVSAGVVRLLTDTGVGELSLLKTVIANHREHKLCLFINPPGMVQAPWLAAANIAAGRVYQVAPQDNDQALWAAEQSLKSGACHCVILWVKALSPKQARRLQVAASHNNALAVVLMPSRCKRIALPVSQDLALTPIAGGLSIQIVKQAQGWPVEDVRVHLTHTPSNQAITAAMAVGNDALASVTHAG